MNKIVCAIWIFVQMLSSSWLLFQCLDKVEVEMKTCEEPWPPNGQSPIALAAGQRLVGNINCSRSLFS